MIRWHIMVAADNIRHLRAWIRGAEARAVTGQVWHRREGSAGAVPIEERRPYGPPLSVDMCTYIFLQVPRY